MSFDIDHAANALRTFVFEDDPALLTKELLTSLRLNSWRYLLLGERTKRLEVAYRILSLTDLKQQTMLEQIASLFAQHHLRWCPIKGADLAWRVWPEKMIRPKGDLDILIHPDDRDMAREVLLTSGWEAQYHYDHPFHEAMMKRHGVALELHFRFPEYGQTDMRALWDRLVPLEKGRYRLPLELNLILLFAHARSHGWSNGISLLLDCGFLVRHEGAPDWDRVAEFVRFGRMVSPALLFCAFPDFFPKGSIPENCFSTEETEIFRRLILSPPMKNPVAERVMSAGNRYSWSWWCDRAKAMSPVAVRRLTDNPQGHYGKLLVGYWTVFWRKFGEFWRFRRGTGDLHLRDQVRGCEWIEASLQKRYGGAGGEARMKER